jgi:hypothetical protein
VISTSSASLRRGLAATALAAVVAAAPVTVHAAPAVEDGGCEGDSGVQVVVDQGPLGGGVVARCVEGGAGRPVAAVTEEAGVALTWVQRYPGAFVCRLDGRPGDLPCADTPPGDRYWGLFVMAPGERSWTYASQGAGSLSVPAGGVVGWRFQGGGELEPPAYDPAARPAETSSRAATTSAGSGSGSGSGSESAGGGRGAAVLGLALLVGLGAAGAVAARRRRA